MKQKLLQISLAVVMMASFAGVASAAPPSSGFYKDPTQKDSIWYVDVQAKNKVEVKNDVSSMLELIARAPAISDAEFKKGSIAPGPKLKRLFRQSGSTKIWYLQPGGTKKYYLDRSDASFAFLKKIAMNADSAWLASLPQVEQKAFDPTKANPLTCETYECTNNAFHSGRAVTFTQINHVEAAGVSSTVSAQQTLIPFARDGRYVLWTAGLPGVSSFLPSYIAELKSQNATDAEISQLEAAQNEVNRSSVSLSKCLYSNAKIVQAGIDFSFQKSASFTDAVADMDCHSEVKL